jgi:hypothetical protein
MANAREYHTATLLPSGKILVIGGWGVTGFLASAEVYDPAMGTWASTGNMTEARRSHTATVLPSGRVFVTGGEDAAGFLASTEVYDPDSGSFAVPHPIRSLLGRP